MFFAFACKNEKNVPDPQTLELNIFRQQAIQTDTKPDY
jgi:hypothetical protein